MDDSRRSVAYLALNTLGLASLGPRLFALTDQSDAPRPGTAGAGSIARHLPNLPFVTQHGKRVRFYDDLVKGRKVLINFMYTECSKTCPRTTANLAKVQDTFGDRMGRDVFFISITLTPERDTPEKLKAYAKQHGCRDGWYFLNGRIEDVDRLRKSLGVYDNNPDVTQHVGILTYGNEPAGRWAATAALASPAQIAWSVKNRLDGWVARPWSARASNEEK